MTTGSVVCFVGESENDALRAAARAHRPWFEQLGYKFVEIDLSLSDASQRLDRALKQGDIALAFGPLGAGSGSEFKASGPDGTDIGLWAAAGIPYLSCLGDSPAYFFDRHVVNSRWEALLYFFPEHHQMRTRLPKRNGLIAIVPPIPFDARMEDDIDFRAKESGRLLFLKNGNDPDKLVASWREALPVPTFLLLADMASDLASRIATEGNPDIDHLVMARFASQGIDLQDFTRLRLLFVAQLDDYLRRVKSTMMGRVLAEFPLDIRGINWEHIDFSRARANYASGVDYTRSGDLIRASLGVIDMSPNTELAPHDRVMRAFGNYTLCLTNEQKFIRSRFTSADSLCFRFDPDHLRERVADVLAHPKRYVELGRNAAKEFRKGRSPQDFAIFLLEVAGHVRAGCGPRPPGLPAYYQWGPAALE